MRVRCPVALSLSATFAHERAVYRFSWSRFISRIIGPCSRFSCTAANCGAERDALVEVPPQIGLAVVVSKWQYLHAAAYTTGRGLSAPPPRQSDVQSGPTLRGRCRCLRRVSPIARQVGGRVSRGFAYGTP